MAIRVGIHPVLEALRAQRSLERIVIAKGTAGPRIQEIVDLAREAGIPVRFEERLSVDRLAAGSTHQGVVALGASTKYAALEPIIQSARMLVVLDGVEDPHNLGAVIRSTHAAGADAVIIPERRAVGVTETVAKAAAGALEHLPVVRVTNINRTLEMLKETGYWIYGLDERGDHLYHEVKFEEPAALVVGAEGKGLHQHVAKHCDYLLRIPMAGRISSLNVSVATAVVLFDWQRRRPETP
jgi:23S rRNA (guanosine2251-2'-O)-methyltransferase